MSVFSLEGGGRGRGRVFAYYERFHSHEQQLCKFIGIKESLITQEKGSTPTGLVSQQHQHGGLDVM